MSRLCDEYDTMCDDETRSPPRACTPPSTRAKVVLAVHLCDRKPSERASGEAFRTLDDAYDPAGLPELHSRVPGHVREVHDDH